MICVVPWYAYGLMIEIEHPDGAQARYGHLGGIASGLAPARWVDAGTVIARLGRTGRTTGPNLPVERRVAGGPAGPLPWLAAAACRDSTELASNPG